jgi:hypothetical protein
VVGTSSKKIAVIAALTTLLPTSALPQQQGGVGTVAGAQPTTATTTTAATPGMATAGAAQTAGGGLTPSPSGLNNTGGLQIDFGLSSKLTFDDNFRLSNSSSGTTTIWDNTLDFNLSSITPLSDLSITGSTVLRNASIPGRSVSGFEDPQVRLRYTRDGVNSRFTLDGRYRHADREFLNPFKVEQEEQALGTLLGGGGTVTWKDYGLTYQTGLNAPLGFQLALKRAETDYDTFATAIDPNTLYDRVTDTANATVTMKVSPVMTVRGSVGLTDFDAQDPVSTSRRTEDYAIGATMDINPVLLLDAQIGFTDITTDTIGGRTTRNGATSAFQLTKTLPNGTIFGNFTSTVNQNGTRSILSFGRTLQLPSGTFSGTVGVTHTPGGSDRLSGSVAYNRVMRSSDITITAQRSVTSNGANTATGTSTDVLNTRIGVAYNYAINTDSALNLALDWGRAEAADSGFAYNTTERTTLSAGYSRMLTQDWNMTGGLQLRHRSDNGGTAQSNAVFLTLDRNFSFRP